MAEFDISDENRQPGSLQLRRKLIDNTRQYTDTQDSKPQKAGCKIIRQLSYNAILAIKSIGPISTKQETIAITPVLISILDLWKISTHPCTEGFRTPIELPGIGRSHCSTLYKPVPNPPDYILFISLTQSFIHSSTHSFLSLQSLVFQVAYFSPYHTFKMKFAYILSALASTAVGAPLLDGLLGGLLGTLPIVSNLGELNGVLGGLLNLGGGGELPLLAILGSLGKLPTGATGAIPSGLPSGFPAGLPSAKPSAVPTSVAVPSTGATPSGVPSADGLATGKLLQDLAPQLNNILVVTGPDAKVLLIELSPEVTALVSGLGLASLGVPLGGIVASAASLGDLLADLGKPVENLVTVVGVDGGALLISLSPEIAALVSDLGLPGVGVPLGTVVAIVGGSL